MNRTTERAHDSKIRVLIVDDVAETGQTISKWLTTAPDVKVVGTATSAREGIALAHRHQPDIVLMDLLMPGMNGIQATQEINEDLPARVILMSVESSREAVQYAMRAGARDYLTKPLKHEDLMRSIRNVAQMATPRVTTGEMGVAPPPRAGQRAQRVIAVCGAKGGVGRSIIASNLAVSLASFAGEVALVDANLQSGDAHVLLNLVHPHNTLENLLDLSEIDFAAIDETADRHDSGLRLLRAPSQPERAEDFTLEFLRGLFVELREHFDMVVADVDSTFTPAAIAAIEQADRLVIVTTLEITSINRVKEFLETMQRYNIPADRCVLVCNRSDGGYQIRPSQIERSLGRRFAAIFPEDVRTVVSSVNHGVPLVLGHRRTAIARAMNDFARHIHKEVMAVNR